ncbi:hypothetical protein [Aquimarina brevivitae]|uniref:Uncharacterized protein n=1 Tax=Aquimarina brevivitae TaxID=323412 RepID=A0A4V2F4U5_9FLAO|nr:hypothetical protein [Aquimarina brevivitae]RZS90539.1 hypothetical protein EV197_3333 [Aquimarina brevivitae]
MKITNLLKIAMAGLILLGGVESGHAQFGKLAKKAKSKLQGKEANDNSTSDSGSNNTSAKAEVEMDWSEFDMSAAVTFRSLLSNTELSDKGSLDVNYYKAVFVPNNKKDGSQASFISDKHIKTKVYKDGELIKEFIYEDSQRSGGNKKLFIKADSQDRIQVDEHGTGTYRIDFYAGQKQYYTFDFEVKSKKNSDAYADLSTLWYVEGPWEDYAYLKFEKGENLILGAFTRHLEFNPNPANPKKTDLDSKYSYKLYKSGNVIAKSKEPRSIYVSRGTYKLEKTSLRLLESKNGSDYINYENIEDGQYKLEITFDHEATPRVFEFEVKDKKVVPIAEQVRSENSDPMKLIEGMNEDFWLKRK